MVYDEWQGMRLIPHTLQTPPWGKVEERLRALDQDIHTEVALKTDASLLIVAGGSGRYVVVVSTIDGRNYTLLDPSKPSNVRETIVASGQPSDFSASVVVDLNAARRAARAYLETGELSKDQSWKEKQ